MTVGERLKKEQNSIIAIVFTILICTIISIFFDCYFDLNDDVLMKDIVAGVYTGKPDGRNIQMLFPISWFISLFYFIPVNISWYGLFLCGCQFFSICIFTKRLLDFLNQFAVKVVILLVEGALIVTLFLHEIVFIQYTVTCTMLAAAAAFLFYTSKIDVSPGKFFKNNIVSIILVILAFQIRSEMLLLVFPLICVTGLCKWATEKPVFTKDNAVKYFSVFGVILLGMLVSVGVNKAAYSSTPWQQFNRFFDSRTEVYDFYGIPPYEENQEFYESIGLAKEEQILLDNYNFGLDEEIDDTLLEQISEYAGEQKAQSGTVTDRLKKALLDYKYRSFHETDYPYNILVMILYVMVLFSALLNKHFHMLWKLPFLGFVRTGLWMYILYNGRDPIRITHSLYFMEIAILLGLYLIETETKNKINRRLNFVITFILATFSILNIGDSLNLVHNKYILREETNQNLHALQTYTKQNSENFYFLDVYSTVSYSEKIFVDVDNSITNHDIMGGWACKSPLMREKYEKYGIQSMEDALINQDHVFYVVQAQERDGMPSSHEWLTAYYRNRNKEIDLIKIDSISTTNGEVFTVYKLQQVN